MKFLLEHLWVSGLVQISGDKKLNEMEEKDKEEEIIPQQCGVLYADA